MWLASLQFTSSFNKPNPFSLFLDTRFFMIKSVDTHNIYQCQEDNIWATSSVAKGDILADAYENTKNVVLFFSANGSRAIQGYVSC